eukprot:EC725180.1.p1 GENE.EC725180.1~~EC725180.1.p1  ORF type:complete len:147 (+),score=0.80 EC725180.1:125-565(+)
MKPGYNSMIPFNFSWLCSNCHRYDERHPNATVSVFTIHNCASERFGGDLLRMSHGGARLQCVALSLQAGASFSLGQHDCGSIVGSVTATKSTSKSSGVHTTIVEMICQRQHATNITLYRATPNTPCLWLVYQFCDETSGSSSISMR